MITVYALYGMSVNGAGIAGRGRPAGRLAFLAAGVRTGSAARASQAVRKRGALREPAFLTSMLKSGFAQKNIEGSDKKMYNHIEISVNVYNYFRISRRLRD